MPLDDEQVDRLQRLGSCEDVALASFRVDLDDRAGSRLWQLRQRVCERDGLNDLLSSRTFDVNQRVGPRGSIEKKHVRPARRAQRGVSYQPAIAERFRGSRKRIVIPRRGLEGDDGRCSTRECVGAEITLVGSNVEHAGAAVRSRIRLAAVDLEECGPVDRKVPVAPELDAGLTNSDARAPRRAERELTEEEGLDVAATPVLQSARSTKSIHVFLRDDARRAEHTPAKRPGVASHRHVVSLPGPAWGEISCAGHLRCRLPARMDVLSTVRRFWLSHAPNSLRRRVGALRASRRESSWRKPRNLGDLRRTTPFSTWGSSRGGPIDRFYIGQFLELHAADISGRALEVAGDEYIRKYGIDVARVDILDVFADNPRATIIADIADAPNIPDDTFDCVLVTQVLPFIYDVRAAFRTAQRILAPGGVLLVTTPGLCRIAPVESEQFGHWRNFTSASARRVAEETFGVGNVTVQSYGNVLAAAAFLFGLGLHDLTPAELMTHDPAFEVTIGIRAAKRI